MQRYPFKIPIGDWSGDGHSQCVWLVASAAKPISDVREAYFAAQKKLPEELHPNQIASDYGDGDVDDKVRQQLFDLGAPIEPVSDKGYYDFYAQEMAELVVWFLNYGDKELAAKLDPEKEMRRLTFYGFDEKGRHIDSIGYGLLQ